MNARQSAALYVRVNTPEQTVEDQERELRLWAGRLGLEVSHVYADRGVSGARGDRVGLAAILAGAHRREFAVLLVWALDRLAREGIGATARYLDQLRAPGVRVISHREPWLDTGGPVGDLLIVIFAWLAERERRRIGERVRAGQARPSRRRAPRPEASRGGPGGDPAAPAPGQGWRRIARALKTSASTLRRKLHECQQSAG